MTTQIVLLRAAAVVIRPSPCRAADAPEEDLAKVQGLWERKTGRDVPGLRRVTKEIKGTHEVITYYGEGDKLLDAHEVDFKRTPRGREDLHPALEHDEHGVGGLGLGEDRLARAVFMHARALVDRLEVL